MEFNKNIVRAKFLKRPNRFEAYVDIDGFNTIVHVPNTGRCREILIPGVSVILREEDGSNRKTKYDIIGAYKNNNIINIDSQIPNNVVAEALKEKRIDRFVKYEKIEREKTFGNSRFDFKLSGTEVKECYLEVKGVTLEENGITRFPDAPTQRGKKHVFELIDVKRSGREAAILFLIQMQNVIYFTPNDKTDKEFGQALRLAYKEGVGIMAYNCNVGEKFITLKDEIEVRL
ncbi:MAG: DNA/RNA nuclease SfsA [Clostridium sp.]|uniref:DNA/RNA nuclease SfsA n=1 Tax=Clostridium sp. TaxID=1506 RepID=UPI0025C41E4C|nr:DNA/RNA nuclease SfsA [Clostridium sp.]MCH3965430.1 DNA/RNA nuclease SfsA [Clostridium sp.]MCI1717289.1 DNA/RNA nuclease SfsA [Clostridium sp.]MCI1801629.1 DNA/RNA nuclease SfsA [Clostridium sp.]MCI1815475.1 DNA/RNA nuclease SfsA [Clostridium sp.]MCI1872378.1 DNA/RNA nuclease SfsA [Clostridium sp.]